MARAAAVQTPSGSCCHRSLWFPVPGPLRRGLHRKGPFPPEAAPCLAQSHTQWAPGDTDDQVKGLTDVCGGCQVAGSGKGALSGRKLGKGVGCWWQ